MLDTSNPILRSPLRVPLSRIASAQEQRRAGVRVAEWADLGCVVLRGRPDDAAFMAAAQAALGLALPTRPSSFVEGDRRVVLWIAPDEWSVLMPREDRDGLVAALREALAGTFSQLVDNSGALTCMRLAGPDHLTVLRHLSLYDFERLSIGCCVSTAIPKATITVVRSDDAGVMLVFRRSFADWIWRLVERSAQPYGLAVCEPGDLQASVFSSLLVPAPADRKTPIYA
jgi:sarcosine oxidase subunit gamma